MVKRKKLTPTHNVKLGKMVVSKGLDHDGESMYVWDVGQKCMHKSCPALEQCQYEEGASEGANCMVMQKYIRSASIILYANQKGLTSAQRFQIGMHIMPLYKILCKLKIEEVGVTRIVSTTERGSLVANPLYKEIRDTIRAIDSVWKSIGAQDVKINISPDFGSSSENYYDRMEKNAMTDMR
jgi:hypothetical protein